MLFCLIKVHNCEHGFYALFSLFVCLFFCTQWLNNLKEMVLLLNNHPEISVVVCTRLKRALNKGLFFWKMVGPVRCVTLLAGPTFTKH